MRFSLLIIVFLSFFIAACNENKADSDMPKVVEDETIATQKFIQNEQATSWNSNWKTNNSVIFHIVGEPASLHPTNEPSTIAQFIFQYTQGFIVRGNLATLVIEPGVIINSNLPINVDDLLLHYAVRNDIFWDDGTPLTVKDIEFTLKTHKCPLVENSQAKAYFENLDSISINIENNSFDVWMKKPSVLNTFFLIDYPILQKSFYDSNGLLDSYALSDFDDNNFKSTASLSAWSTVFNSAKFGRNISNLNGLGAYRVDKWDSGNSIRLVKKLNHWTASLTNPSSYETTHPDTIIFQLNTDPNSQYLEFKNQNFDGSGYLSSQTMTKLLAEESFNENYHAAFLPSFNYSFAAMNIRPDGDKHPLIFNDKKVRQAMAYLTPVDDMIALLFEGKSTRRLSAVSSLKNTFNKSIQEIPVDLYKAKELLGEAGWKDSDSDGYLDKVIDGNIVPLEFELLCMNNISIWGDMAELMAETMKKAGVNAKITLVDYTVLYKKAADHDFDMLLLAWGGSSFPDDHTQIWHTSSWLNNGSNFTGFGSTESDSLIELSITALDLKKRIELENQIQQIIYEEQPYIFLLNGSRKVVLHKRFNNANMYSEKPGVLLNNLHLSNTVKQTVSVEP